MELNELYLRDFRNYGEETISFCPGMNLILGKNAQGKTNLLEAIAYLGSGKSFRAQKTGEMVRFQAPFGEISGQVFSEGREQSLRWVLFSGSRPRQIYRNGVKKKSAGEVFGMLPTVLFSPEDLQMLRGGAAPRRRFADTALCQLRPNYEAVLGEYTHLLESKARILKDRETMPQIMDVLPDYNLRLCQVGAVIISYRARFFQALEAAAKNYHGQFSAGAEAFSLSYKTVSTVEDPLASTQELFACLQKQMEKNFRAELETCQCLSGPHKDDFVIALSGVDLKSYGSQGQTRTATISLKLALREMMKKQFGEEPVLLLDDVLSELDEGRQDFVLNHIESGQVFITSCEPDRLSRVGKKILIESGSVMRV